MRLITVVLCAGMLTTFAAHAASTSSVRKTAEQVATLLLEGETDELQSLALDYELAAQSLRKVEKRGKARYDEAMARYLAHLVKELAQGKDKGELVLKRIELAEVVTAPAGRGKRKTDIVLAQTRAVFELDGKETPGLEICFLAAEGRWRLVDKCR